MKWATKEIKGYKVFKGWLVKWVLKEHKEITPDTEKKLRSVTEEFTGTFGAEKQEG